MTTTQPNMDVGKFNDLINKASELLSCDETCQRNKKQLQLKEKYLKSKVNYLTAPAQVETTYKNYLTYTEGEVAYSEHNKKVLSEKARALAKTFASEFHEQIQKAKSLIATYDGLFVNYAHVVEYYDDLVQKNKIMTLSLKNKSSDIVTNDRKTYYEDQKVDSLYFYYRVILFIYLVVLISYAVSIIFRPAEMGRKKQTIILVIFIIYPFVAARLFLFVGDMVEKLKTVLPKNVYRNETTDDYSPNQQRIDIANRQPQRRKGGCGDTTFGCCPGGTDTKVDKDGTNCDGYVSPCGDSTYGCCSDGITSRVDAVGTNCTDYCGKSTYGCCSDGITTKVDAVGTNCSDYVIPVV